IDRAVVVKRRANAGAARASALFYSGRIRHTSSTRDLSSDVCSSDLIERPCVVERSPLPAPQIAPAQTRRPGVVDRSLRKSLGVRSEERRVGKECSYRCSAAAYVEA